jgi:hypothetical protein
MHFFVHGANQSDFSWKTRTASGDRRVYIYGSSGAFNSHNTGPTNSYTPGQWNHFALVRRSGVAEFYINGNLSYTFDNTNFANYSFSASKPSLMGWGNSSEFTKGAFDEYRIWNTARTQSQIVAFKDQELNGTEPNLVAYYDFSDGPGSSTVTDQSTNTNDGSLINMDVANDWIAATHTIGDALSLDNTAPTATVTGPASPTSTTPFQISITFDEEVAGFDLTDISVGNGAASNLNTVDNIVYTADIIGATDAAVTVDIAANAVTDLHGNGNVAATQFGIDYISPENALQLDGDNDYVTLLSSGLNFTNAFTIEMWVKPDLLDANSRFPIFNTSYLW